MLSWATVAYAIATPNLSIVSSHADPFIQGQMFRKFSIVVSNIGLGSTSGVVTVTDTVPSGLTVVSIGGSGWTCKPAVVSCTRSDALAFNTSYPAITLTVNVATNAPVGTATNTAVVSGGGSGAHSSNDSTTIAALGPTCGMFTSTTLPSATAGVFTVGDFNGDGYADIAVASGAAQEVLVYLNNGSGTFGTPNHVAVPDIGFVASGDFNGDGRLDLAASTNATSVVSIRLGNGDGTFTNGSDFAVATYPESIVIADFNKDGILDIATGSGSDFAISILLGAGDGTFLTHVDYPTPGTPAEIAVGDFNGDGVLDLASPNPRTNNVSIYFGSGSGTFSGRTEFAAGNGPASIVAQDVNGDGKLDLLVANTLGNSVSVLLGTGPGSFASAVDYPTGSSPERLAAADFDHDGNLDIAVANDSGDGVWILHGNGNGTFATGVPEIAVVSPRFLAVGEFNGDGRPDLAVWDSSAGLTRAYMNACPDLTLTKTHTGNFTQGQTGVTYTITATNGGLAATRGTVSVVDTLPTGLTLTGLTGTNWNCTPATLTCTRSDALAAGSSYEPITVTVNVNSDAPASVTNLALVSGGGDIITNNNFASSPTTVNAALLIAPTNVVATAASTPSVSGVTWSVGVTWNGVTGATAYEVYRQSPGAMTLIATTAATTLADDAVVPNAFYVYSVRAADPFGNFSPLSIRDAATTISFTDPVLVPGSAVIRAVHLIQLRTAVNAALLTAGLSPVTFTDPTGLPIREADINDLRGLLGQARSLLTCPTLVYTDPILSAGMVVKAVHIQELRNGVK